MSVKKPRTPIVGDDDNTAKALRETRKAVEDLDKLTGTYLTNADGGLDITLTNNAINKLQHKLGRKLKGWQLRDIRPGTNSVGSVVRATTSGGVTADDAFDLWLNVRGWVTNSIIVRIVVY